MININIDEKPISISLRYNAYYKLVLLLAIIYYCGYGKKASLIVIHIVFWGLRNNENFEILLQLKKEERKTLVPWAFEHGMDNILSIGVANGLISRIKVTDDLTFSITEQGISLLKTIYDNKYFPEDMEKIKSLKVLPKAKIERANQNWNLF